MLSRYTWWLESRTVVEELQYKHESGCRRLRGQIIENKGRHSSKPIAGIIPNDRGIRVVTSTGQNRFFTSVFSNKKDPLRRG